MSKKNSLILLGVGAGIALIICCISLSLYGKIYFFDGYDITKFAWVVAGGCVLLGIIGLLRDHKALIIGIVIILMIILVASCSKSCGNGGRDYPYGYEECFRCKGSGLVNQGFIDLKTCPTCKGSGMLDSH